MTLNIVLWAVLIIALYTDLKERRIPNKLLLIGVIAGIAAHLYYQGLTGVWFGLKGMLVGLALLFLPFVMGGIGAGDVKLLGTIGLIKGSAFVMVAALATALAGGILALIVLIKRKQLLASLRRIGYGIYILLTSKNVSTLKTLDQAEYSEALPYGLAIFMGTLGATFLL